MLTPQEVSAHAFTKAMMGGYNMAMVDEFLDEVTADYTALYKENAALKAKLKVLVEKVEEYRATEDSMRATLLTAQKMADSIVREAEEKREEILAQAEASARERLEEYRREAAREDQRLKQGRQELARFIAAGRELCARELEFLDELPALPVDQEEVPMDIPATATRIKGVEQADPVSAESLFSVPPQENPPQAGEEAELPLPEETPPQPETEEDPALLEATRRINLNDLKFGRNYSGEHS